MPFTSTDRDNQKVPYTYQAYPKHVYHADHPGFKQVENEAEWLALGPGWGHPSDAPSTVTEPEAAIADAEPAVADKPRKRKARD